MTADRPFRTHAGRKVIDPARVARAGAAAPAQMAIGDRLSVLTEVAHDKRPVKLGTAALAVTRIARVDADPATPLYNLRLSGNGTFFGNGMLFEEKQKQRRALRFTVSTLPLSVAARFRARHDLSIPPAIGRRSRE